MSRERSGGSITSCCRTLKGPETPKTVAVTMEFQLGSRILMKTFDILSALHHEKRFLQLFSRMSCLMQEQRGNSEFLETKLE